MSQTKGLKMGGMMRRIVLLPIIAVALSVAPAAAGVATTDSFNDVPCDQVLSGVMFCGVHDVAIPAAPQGSHDGVPLPTVEPVGVTLIIDGHQVTTGAAEAKAIVAPHAETDAEYHARLLVQLCEAKPVFCEG